MRRRCSNVLPFATDDDVIAFAKVFLTGRIKGFRKDIRVCLRASKGRHHAYLPGLITCIAFFDLLSGLFCGKLDGHGHKEFVAFTTVFLDPARYTRDELDILYLGFRHKLAHLGHPYAVFDTGRKPRVFPGPKRRIAWTIYKTHRPRPITLTRVSPPMQLKHTKVPWPVSYDQRIEISVASLGIDARKAAEGYLAKLVDNAPLLENFRKCMTEFYPA